MTLEEARRRVLEERKRRGLSMRAAAALGEISNETWRRYENGGPLTATARKGIAQAFGWPTAWPEEDPTNLNDNNTPGYDLAAGLRQIDGKLDHIIEQVSLLGVAMASDAALLGTDVEGRARILAVIHAIEETVIRDYGGRRASEVDPPASPGGRAPKRGRLA